MNSKKLNNVFALVLAAVLTVGLLPARASAASVTFTDVSPSAWYYNDVTYLANKGIVSGVGDNKFEPNREVADCEMLQMVINSFFKSEYDAYEAANYNTMQAYFGSNTYWFSFKAYYAKTTGLLDGINMDINSYTSCYVPMSRYEMAMILYNAAKAKGLSASEADKAIAKAEMMNIGHYYDIPTTYQEAVVTCYALGLLNGKGSLGFCGADNMTRAEACIVIVRLENRLAENGGGSTTNPAPVETPTQPVEPTVKDIVVTTTTATNNSKSYSITDNGFGTGYLNNGKEINDANIAELLAKAKEIWPDGMTWTESGSANNNFYSDQSSIVYEMLRSNGTGATNNLNSNYACGGFVAMISDYLFGKTANPYHRVTNFSDIHPGDVVVMLNANNTTNHAVIVTGINQTGSRAGYAFTAEGNANKTIYWPGTSAWDAAGPEDLAAYGSYVILSRWPS